MITFEKKSLKVGKLVGSEHVEMVTANYKKERWAPNSERIGKSDSLSVWFSAEELEEYIKMIQKNGADGVKFYFGAYPENFQERPEYSGRQTIVMVATKSKETENGIVNKDLYVRNNGTLTVMGLNMGSLCPPYCGGFSFTTKTVGDADVANVDHTNSVSVF
ncbi:MAG: hypothetical protein JST75_18210 [Bacteroidetes bacterium]|nr:hypothetical protein [Bacteroidota bacterium]